jgi:K+-sensing histidine kinase KdpD
MSLRREPESSSTEPSLVRRWITPITVSLLLVAVTTAILWTIQPRLQQEHLIFIYFVPTTLIAIRYGSLSAMGVIIASSLAAAYFLYPPNFSFLVGSRLEFLEIVLFSMLALLASQVVSGFAKDDDVVKRRRPVAVPTYHGKRSGWSGTLNRLRAKIALF